MGLGLSGLRLGLGQQLWGTVWSPASLFPTGTEEGLFLDFSDISTLYTDQTFSTNISAIGDPVGGVIDKSQGGVPGPELVTNGTFATDTTGWTGQPNTTLSVVDGAMQVALSASISTYVYQDVPTASGVLHRFSVRLKAASGSLACKVYNGGGFSTELASASVTEDGTFRTYTFCFRAISSSSRVAFGQDGSSVTYYVDDVSIKPLPGNHLIQATAAARPIWTRHPKSGVRNLWSEVDWSTANIVVADVEETTEVSPPTQVPDSIVFKAFNLSTSSYVSKTSFEDGTSVGVDGNTKSIYARSASGEVSVNVCGYSGIAGNKYLVTLTEEWQLFEFPIDTAETAGNLFYMFDTRGTGTSGVVLYVCNAAIVANADAGQPQQRRVSKYNVTEAGVDDCYGLTFDGVDDYLVTAANLDLSGTDAISSCLGAVTTSASTRSVLLNTGAATPVYYEVRWPSGANTTLGSYYISGVTNQIAEKAGVAFGTPKVVSATNDTTGTSAILRIDGAQEGSSVLDPGVYVFPDAVASIGANSAGTYPTAGTIYGVTLTDYILDAEQLVALEAWTAARTPEVTLA